MDQLDLPAAPGLDHHGRALHHRREKTRQRTRIFIIVQFSLLCGAGQDPKEWVFGHLRGLAERACDLLLVRRHVDMYGGQNRSLRSSTARFWLLYKNDGGIY